MINNTFWRIDLEHYNLLGSAVLGITSIAYSAEIHGVTIEDSNIGIYSGIDANGDINFLNVSEVSIKNISMKS